MLPSLLREVRRAGHVVFTDGSANLIVQRSSQRRAGEMDDLISVVRYQLGLWIELAWPCSADPGRSALRKAEHPRGTAILAPGQYRGAYELGEHKGRAALRQVLPVTVRRDGDRDELLEPGATDVGLFGVHVHDDAGVGAEASAGCVVLERTDMGELLDELSRDIPKWGRRWTLTVLEVG